MSKMLEDIKPISKRPKSAPIRESVRKQSPAVDLPREVPFEPSEPRPHARRGLWYIAAICIVALLFSLSYLFERATVRITPKSVAVALDSTDTFTAVKDGNDPGTIIYTMMTLSGDESIKLPSTTSKTQSVAASGRVVLYNEYTTAAYNLVKNTRLATADGKVYRTNAAITIPGMKKSGTTVTPGAVEVTVTASAAGESYNIDKSDFTLPGLAGTPQAKLIYGRTKSAITGGISGLVYSIPQDTANAALGTLQGKLKDSLYAKAKVQVPEGYIFYEGATRFSTDETVQVPYSTNPEVPLALHGTLVAYLIKENSLVSAIAKRGVSQYADEPITIPNIESLKIVPASAMNPSGDTTFPFTLSGSATVVWDVDGKAIQTALSGTKKANFSRIMATITGVDQADMVLKPFWKRSFPKDTERIFVEVAAP